MPIRKAFRTLLSPNKSSKSASASTTSPPAITSPNPIPNTSREEEEDPFADPIDPFADPTSSTDENSPSTSFPPLTRQPQLSHPHTKTLTTRAAKKLARQKAKAHQKEQKEHFKRMEKLKGEVYKKMWVAGLARLEMYGEDGRRGGGSFEVGSRRGSFEVGSRGGSFGDRDGAEVGVRELV